MVRFGRWTTVTVAGRAENRTSRGSARWTTVTVAGRAENSGPERTRSEYAASGSGRRSCIDTASRSVNARWLRYSEQDEAAGLPRDLAQRDGAMLGQRAVGGHGHPEGLERRVARTAIVGLPADEGDKRSDL